MWQMFPKTRRNKRRQSICSAQSLIAVENLEARKLLTTFVSNDVPKNILDFSTVTSTLDVSLTGETLADVNVSLTIRHSYDRDLDIFLIAPDGRSIELCTDVGAFLDNFIGTTFDDEAETAISAGVAPFSGVFRPEGSLQILRGMDPAGTWRLRVGDDGQGDIGTLDSWSLDLATTGAGIVSLTEVSPDPRNVPVDNLDLVTTHPLRLSSFTFADVTLTRNGTPVPLDDRVTISTAANSNTYRIQGLDAFTSVKGNYVLTVSTEGLAAQDGGSVFGRVSDSWTLKGSSILSLSEVSPSQRNTPVSEIIATFSDPVNLSTFSRDDFVLRRNGDIVPLTDSVTIARIGQTSGYRISGLETVTNRRGSYELTLLTRRIIDEQGLAAEGSKTVEWLLTGPTVSNISGISGRLRNSPVGIVSVEFLFPLDPQTIDVSDIELRRNNLTVPLDSVTIVPTTNGRIFEIRGLSQVTQQNGSYELRVSANSVRDLFGNNGNGTQTVLWDVVGPQVTEVTLPVPGTTNTAVDTVEVSFLFRPDLTTFDFNDVSLRRNGTTIQLNSSVEISEIGQTNTYRISGLSAFTRQAGHYAVEVFGRGIEDLQGRTGGGTDIAVWQMVGPWLSTFVNPPGSLVNQALNSIDVRFFYSPAAETFDFNDIKLTLNNNPVPLSSQVVVTQLTVANTFRISGLDSFTQRDGVYSLQINGFDLADEYGNIGFGFVSTGWTMDATKPASATVVSVTPDPRVGRNRALRSIAVEFNERIVPSTVSFEDFSLQLNGGPNLLNERVTISQSFDGKSLTISGLRRLTAAAGEYKFRVLGSFSDTVGNAATLTAEETWKVIDAPFISSYGRTRVYREDSGPVRLMGYPLVTDADSTAFPGGSLTVKVVENQGNNRLGLLNLPGAFSYVSINGNEVLFEGNVIGVKSGGDNAPLVIQLNANATPVAVSALLRSVTFQSPGEQLFPSTRNVLFELYDGTGATGMANVAVTIAAVDDPATITADASVTYQINRNPKVLAPQGTVQDPDTIRFTDYLLRARVTKGRDGTETLGLSSAFTVVDSSVSFQGVVIGRLENIEGNSGVLIVRLNGNSTQRIVQALFRSITFRTSGSASLASRTVGFSLQSTLGNTDMASIEILLQ